MPGHVALILPRRLVAEAHCLADGQAKSLEEVGTPPRLNTEAHDDHLHRRARRQVVETPTQFNPEAHTKALAKFTASRVQTPPRLPAEVRHAVNFRATMSCCLILPPICPSRCTDGKGVESGIQNSHLGSSLRRTSGLPARWPVQFLRHPPRRGAEVHAEVARATGPIDLRRSRSVNHSGCLA